jgi:hypothetical protein
VLVVLVGLVALVVLAKNVHEQRRCRLRMLLLVPVRYLAKLAGEMAWAFADSCLPHL